MSSKVFRGNPGWKKGIPRNSKIRIEVLPQQTLVYSNDRVSEQVTVDLDPGYYHAVIKKFLGKNAMGRLSQIRYEEKFYHDITPEEYAVLSTLRPVNATAKMTSEGWIFSCGYTGCDHYYNNPMAMVLHECEHKGITREDLVKNSDLILDENMTEVAAVETKKRGPKIGRSYTSEQA